MYLTAEEIEQIAARVVSAYRKLPALSGKVISCIDPLILATDLLHLKVEYHKLSPEGTILGLTVLSAALIGVYDNGETEFREMDGRTLFIERDLLQANVGRHNFTLTHEASHQMLKMLYPSAYAAAKKLRRVFCSARGRVGGGWEEWQANQLTAAILMPRDLLLTHYRYLIEMNEEGAGLFYNGETIETRELNFGNTYLSPAKVVGSIPCGEAALEDEYVEEYLNIPASLFGKGEFYILRAKGDSMTDAGINEGDLVVIRKQQAAAKGDIVVALDEESRNTLKRLGGSDGEGNIVLEYMNEAVYPGRIITVKELIVQGVAEHVIKHL